jgi:hypothetical protein
MEVVLGALIGTAYTISPEPANITTVRCGLRIEACAPRWQWRLLCYI